MSVVANADGVESKAHGTVRFQNSYVHVSTPQLAIPLSLHKNYHWHRRQDTWLKESHLSIHTLIGFTQEPALCLKSPLTLGHEEINSVCILLTGFTKGRAYSRASGPLR
ncbi:hypothetical protein J6590_072827 [Homalodisca vitripennis]|nr:hypothetical protein J6590_072827 [Homalodisca vitripennis]